MITAEITGIKELLNQLDRIPKALKQELEATIIKTAQEYLKDVQMHHKNMIRSQSGKMFNTLRMERLPDEDNNEVAIGWFQDAPDYVKYVLLGTIHKEARNPLLSAYNEQKMVEKIKKDLVAKLETIL